MKKEILKSEFAKMQGITRGRVSQLLKAGIISQTESGKIDWRKAKAQLKTHQERKKDPLNSLRMIEWDFSCF